MAISKAKLAAIAAGMCAECHTARPAEGRKRCSDCLAYVAMRERERRARLRDECPKKRRQRTQRVRRMLAAKRLAYVTASGCVRPGPGWRPGYRAKHATDAEQDGG